MKAIVLCADYVFKMKGFSHPTCRALLTVRRKPIIEYILNKLQLVEEIDHIYIVSSQRFSHRFKKWKENFVTTVALSIINDGSDNHKDRPGAMKDLALVIEKENIEDDVLVIGGDNLFSFSLEEFIGFTKAVYPHNVIGVYELNGNYKPEKFEVVKLDESKKVIDFYEKPSGKNGSTLVSMCLYYFPREKLPLIKEYIKKGNDTDKSGNYIQWLTHKDSVYGFTFEGMWLDIGDMDSYREAVFTF